MPKKQVQQSSVQVRVIEAQPGGVFVERVWVGCDTFAHAQATADRLQREFDEDSDPCRSYVYKDNDPVPVYAGLAVYYPHPKKDFNRKGNPFRKMV
jgi:hypothetical protein